jgi:hypothetical protein
MLITAKYSSRCPSCQGQIAVGSRVEWERGAPARHAVCPTAGAQATPEPRRKSTRAAGPRYRAARDGEVMIARVANGRGDTYDVGQTVYVQNLTTGGGPDGRYWRVTHSWYARACEDAGHYDDQAMAYVVPATAEEAAPVAARRAARSAGSSS